MLELKFHLILRFTYGGFVLVQTACPHQINIFLARRMIEPDMIIRQIQRRTISSWCIGKEIDLLVFVLGPIMMRSIVPFRPVVFLRNPSSGKVDIVHKGRRVEAFSILPIAIRFHFGKDSYFKDTMIDHFITSGLYILSPRGIKRNGSTIFHSRILIDLLGTTYTE